MNTVYFPACYTTHKVVDWLKNRPEYRRLKIDSFGKQIVLIFEVKEFLTPKENKLSPLIERYNKIRAQLPAGTILLFRLGDYYEMFFEDAGAGAEILGIPLCERNKVPMAGVPVSDSKGYIGKLLKAGKKVAICDDVGDLKGKNQL